MTEPCVHCQLNRERFKGKDGVAYHRYKESNGLDDDRYTSPCLKQTAKALEKYREKALKRIAKQIRAQTTVLKSLQTGEKNVKKAKTMLEIDNRLYHIEFLSQIHHI